MVGVEEGAWSKLMRYLICCRSVIFEMSTGEGGGAGPEEGAEEEEAEEEIGEEEEAEGRVGEVLIGAQARYLRFFSACELKTGL